MRTGLKGLLQKKWFLGLLILALIVESSLLIIILVESYLGTQNFPQISIIPYVEPQCGTLTATMIAPSSGNNTGAYQNRTVTFTCPGKTALRIFPLDSWTCPTCRDPTFLPVVPVFNLPKGYLTLSATSTVTVTSLGTFGGRVNFTLYASCDHCGLTPTFMINPASVFLKPGGSNYTEVTFTTDSSISPAIIHYSLAGYGAFVPSASTNIDVVVT